MCTERIRKEERREAIVAKCYPKQNRTVVLNEDNLPGIFYNFYLLFVFSYFFLTIKVVFALCRLFGKYRKV